MRAISTDNGGSLVLVFSAPSAFQCSDIYNNRLCDCFTDYMVTSPREMKPIMLQD
jgi:hypothetical protein